MHGCGHGHRHAVHIFGARMHGGAQGSRDRLHARSNAVETAAALALASSIAATGSGSAGARDDEGSGHLHPHPWGFGHSARASGDASTPSTAASSTSPGPLLTWQHAADLSLPVIVSQSPVQASGPSVPSSTASASAPTAGAASASGATMVRSLLVWPACWLSIALPASALASMAGYRLALHAQLLGPDGEPTPTALAATATRSSLGTGSGTGAVGWASSSIAAGDIESCVVHVHAAELTLPHQPRSVIGSTGAAGRGVDVGIDQEAMDGDAGEGAGGTAEARVLAFSIA